MVFEYYDPNRPETPEAIALHDADTLDFLGIISATRVLAIVGKEKVTPHIKDALKVLDMFQKTLPEKLYGGAYTREMGKARAFELNSFLKTLERESYGFILP